MDNNPSWDEKEEEIFTISKIPPPLSYDIIYRFARISLPSFITRSKLNITKWYSRGGEKLGTTVETRGFQRCA